MPDVHPSDATSPSTIYHISAVLERRDDNRTTFFVFWIIRGNFSPDRDRQYRITQSGTYIATLQSDRLRGLRGSFKPVIPMNTSRTQPVGQLLPPSLSSSPLLSAPHNTPVRSIFIKRIVTLRETPVHTNPISVSVQTVPPESQRNQDGTSYLHLALIIIVIIVVKCVIAISNPHHCLSL